ncbi:MAG: DUF427 domain-containing protein [Leptospirales bacterium]
MIKAVWNNVVIAEARKTEMVENNHYFPPESLKQEYFESGLIKTTCPWKGVASYYDIIVNGERNESGAWYYPEPKKEASNIKGYVAFWQGVEIVEDSEFDSRF